MLCWDDIYSAALLRWKWQINKQSANQAHYSELADLWMSKQQLLFVRNIFNENIERLLLASLFSFTPRVPFLMRSANLVHLWFISASAHHQPLASSLSLLRQAGDIGILLQLWVEFNNISRQVFSNSFVFIPIKRFRHYFQASKNVSRPAHYLYLLFNSGQKAANLNEDVAKKFARNTMHFKICHDTNKNVKGSF